MSLPHHDAPANGRPLADANYLARLRTDTAALEQRLGESAPAAADPTQIELIDGRECVVGDAWEPPDDAATPEPVQNDQHAPRGYQFKAIASQAFFTGDYRLEWLVKRMLVAGQPAVLGGPRKAMKTSILIDLAVSLASGTPFLGAFDVYRRRRVVLISGESGEAVLQETGRRICAARGVDPTTLDVFWSFRLPQLANVLDRGALSDGLKQLGAGVAFIDPLYLCLLSGGDLEKVEAGNLYQMGPLLLAVARACLDAGATPLLAHHSRKNLTHPDGPLELEDLAFSGIQEFARQWLLLNRREPFNPDTGEHRLWLSAGGSAGQAGLWGVDITEGVLAADFTGRRWEVIVRTGTEIRGEQAEVGDARKQAELRRMDKADDAKVLQALDEYTAKGKPARTPKKKGKAKAKDTAPTESPPAKLPSVNDLQVYSRISHARTKRAVARLVSANIIEGVEMIVFTGRNHKVQKSVNGYRRRQAPATEPTEPTVSRLSAQ